LITVAAAAREIGTSTRKVHDLIAAGHLRTRTLPGDRYPRVIRASIDDWLDDGAPDAPERRVRAHAMVIPPLGGRAA
jgi:hypothetical protein